jgi:bifunctional non-homologous end joining protein LigD
LLKILKILKLKTGYLRGKVHNLVLLVIEMKKEIIQKYHHNFRLSNLEKIFYDNNGYTKEDILKYYHKISDIMLYHLFERPINMQRAPDGLLGESFFQQEISDYFPGWIDRVTLKKRGGGKITHVICNDRDSLVYLANQAVITIHIWLSQRSSPEKPDRILFDLDPPPNGSFEDVKDGALKLKQYFDHLQVKSFIMTTGSKGLHLVVPIHPEHEFNKVRDAAKQIAMLISDHYPERFTTQQLIKKRENRVFLDYIRNSYGQTSVCPYSIRLIKGAPIATPIDWEDLKRHGLNSKTYDLGNIFKRLSKKKDPWKDINDHRVSLEKIQRSK